MWLNKILVFRISSILLIIILTFPVVKGYFDIRDYIFLIGYSILCLAMYPKAFFNKRIASLTLFLLLLLLVFSDHQKYDFIYSLFEFFSIFAAVAIINICFYKKDFKSLKIITVATLVILGATTLLTIPLLIEDSNAVRESVGFVIDDDPVSLQLAQREGIMNYATVHSIPFMFPMLIYFIKRKGTAKLRILWLLIVLVLLFLIIKSSTTTPIILSVVGIILALIINGNKQTSFIKLFSLGIVATIIANSDLLLSFLESVEPVFAGSAVAPKIDDFKKFIQVGQVGSQIGYRDSLHNMSWNTFFDNPFLGSRFIDDAGGHSFFVDKLAYLGLIGAVPLFLFVFLQFQSYLKFFSKEIKIYYLIALMLFVFLGFSKNIIGFEYWLYLFVILPGLAFFHLRDRTHLLNNSK